MLDTGKVETERLDKGRLDLGRLEAARLVLDLLVAMDDAAVPHKLPFTLGAPAVPVA
jgi:hypothetical protein